MKSINRKIMKNAFKLFTVLLLVFIMTSCVNDRKRQIQYMADTDMYSSVPYDTYASDAVFENDMEARLPAVGSVARGKIPYDYPNTEEGYQHAKDSLRSPLEINTVNLERGKYLYDIYCISCHGVKGDGQGELVTRGKFLGVPNYKDRQITPGSIYHVIMYGRNLMGSHASQLNETERWQVVEHVEQLRNDLLKQ